MSALAPHIRVLRELAKQFDAESEQSFSCITDGAHDADLTPMLEQNGSLLGRLSSAYSAAADQLEAEEAALRPPLEDEHSERPITFNPKGKPTT